MKNNRIPNDHLLFLEITESLNILELMQQASERIAERVTDKISILFSMFYVLVQHLDRLIGLSTPLCQIKRGILAAACTPLCLLAGTPAPHESRSEFVDA